MSPYEAMTRMIPSDYEAETTVLGYIIANPEIMKNVIQRLKPEDFLDPTNQAVYTAMMQAFADKKLIDELVIKSYNPEICLSTISRWADGCAKYEYKSMENWVDLVLKAAMRRKILDKVFDIEAKAFDGQVEPHFILSTAIPELQKLHDETCTLNSEIIRDNLAEQSEYIQTLLTPKVMEWSDRLFIRSKPILNGRLNGGFKKGRNYIISGRPGSGKTSFMLDLILELASDHHPGLIFELENSKDDTLDKIYARYLERDSEYLAARDPGYIKVLTQKEEFSVKLREAGQIVGSYIFIESGVKAIEDIVRLIHLYVTKYRIEWFALDYLQMIQHNQPKIDSFEHIKRNILSLVDVTKNRHLVALILSQANRPAEGKNVTMANMYGSSYIEQSADAVFALQHDPDERKQDDQIQFYLEILKNRYGRAGKIKLDWMKTFGKFTESMNQS